MTSRAVSFPLPAQWTGPAAPGRRQPAISPEAAAATGLAKARDRRTAPLPRPDSGARARTARTEGRHRLLLSP